MFANVELLDSRDFTGVYSGGRSQLVPGIINHSGPVQAQPIDSGSGGGITTQPVARQTPNDGGTGISATTNNASSIGTIYGEWLSYTGQPQGDVNAWWAKIPSSLQNSLLWEFNTGNQPTPATLADSLSSIFGIGAEPPSAYGGGPTDSSNPGTSTPTQNPADCTQDPTLCALLSSIAGGGSGATLPAGVGVPTGTIGSAPQSSGGSSIVVIIVLVALAVGGYFLWNKYKGKLFKHEAGQNE